MHVCHSSIDSLVLTLPALPATSHPQVVVQTTESLDALGKNAKNTIPESDAADVPLVA